MEYRNPIYTIDNRINCEINHPIYGWIPFTADPNDVELHGRKLYEQILNDGNIKDYNPPNDLAEIVRTQRNLLLAQSDWSQLSDVPQAIKDKFAIYRQKLRDIPTQQGFPFKIEWPTNGQD